MINVVVLQKHMDLLKGEVGSSSKTCATSTLDGYEVTGMGAERVCNIKEEKDQQPTISVIKMEPSVSCVLWCVLRIFYIDYVQNYLPVYQSVLVKQKFDS